MIKWKTYFSHVCCEENEAIRPLKLFEQEWNDITISCKHVLPSLKERRPKGRAQHLMVQTLGRSSWTGDLVALGSDREGLFSPTPYGLHFKLVWWRACLDLMVSSCPIVTFWSWQLVHLLVWPVHRLPIIPRLSPTHNQKLRHFHGCCEGLRPCRRFICRIDLNPWELHPWLVQWTPSPSLRTCEGCLIW